MKNPNATTATASGGLGVAVVWLLGYLGIDLSAELGAAVATGLAAVALFIGRNGICGGWTYLLHGSQGPPAKKPRKKPAAKTKG
jgi:hypothetical protein